jgi:hypothetical protein
MWIIEKRSNYTGKATILGYGLNEADIQEVLNELNIIDISTNKPVVLFQEIPENMITLYKLRDPANWDGTSDLDAQFINQCIGHSTIVSHWAA